LAGALKGTIKMCNLYNEQVRHELRLVSPSQMLLLYVLFCRPAKKINLQQIEQELKNEYTKKGQEPPELLNLQQSYENLPAELKRLVQSSFNVIDSKGYKTKEVCIIN
jgi:hypothetical protein